MQTERALAGAFPKPPGAGLGREAAKNRRFSILPFHTPEKTQMQILTTLEIKNERSIGKAHIRAAPP